MRILRVCESCRNWVVCFLSSTLVGYLKGQCLQSIEIMSRYALIIGIGQYQQLDRLSKPRTDAEAVCDLLRDRGNFDQVHLLLDAEATYAALMERLEYVLLEQGDRAEVLLYFTGHGFTAGPSKRSRQGYLATYDCQVKWDGKGSITSSDQALSFQELNAFIQEAKTAKLAMLLDCCHSEFFVEQSLIESGLSGFRDRSYFLSAACRSYEQAWANTDENHSVYTGALLQVLRNRQVSEITASEAHNDIERRLKGSGQEPIPFGFGRSLVLIARQRDLSSMVSEVCPYQSLNAFTPETAQFFFGREAEIADLGSKLAKSNFVPVMGPSGSGKSSLVRAGLVTQLSAQSWDVITMKPGSAPEAMLRATLEAFFAQQSMGTGERRALLACLESEGLVAMANRLPTQKRLLLIVDQFEEVFTQCAKEVQNRFIGELVAVGQAKTPLAVVMTMRSDFVDDWLRVGQPPAVIRHDTVWLGPLLGENLQAAIVQPAQKQGYQIGDVLLDYLLRAVEEEENCLPLLEFVLTGLWEQRNPEKRELTAAAYLGMGKLTGALDEHANKVYGRMRDEDKKWAKQICLQLVRIDKKDKDTRQRQPKQMLLNMGGQDSQVRQAIADVIQDLVDGRLLVTDSDVATTDIPASDISTIKSKEESAVHAQREAYVDLAHEALLEGWTQFKAWRLEDRDLLRLEQRMKDAYEEWTERQDDRYLLTGGLLAEVRENRAVLSNRLSDSLPALMKYFADSDQKDEANVAMLKTALAKSEMQEASRKIRDKLLFTPAQTVEATIETISLVGKSQAAFEDVIHPAQDALHRTFRAINEQAKLTGHKDWVTSVAFSPKGDLIVSGSDDRTLRLWDLAGNPVGQPFAGHTKGITLVSFSPKGDLIVSGSDDRTLRLWNLEGDPVGKPFVGHRDWIRSLAFSPKGDLIVSGSDDRTLRLWNLKGNPVGKPFIIQENILSQVFSFTSVVFNPEGNRILSGNIDGTLRLWDLEGNTVGKTLPGEQAEPFVCVAFNSNGSLIVSGGTDSTLRLWNSELEPIGTPFTGHSRTVSSVAFSPKGDQIISGSEDGTLRLWDLDGNVVGEPFFGHDSLVYSVSFNPRGGQVASASQDGTVRLWSLKNDFVAKPFAGHSSSVLSVAFSKDGSRIVSSSSDDTLRMWDLDGKPIGKPFIGHSRAVNSIALSPRRNQVVSGSDDGTLRLWDLDGNQVDEPFIGHEGSVRSVAFSPSGYQIVSGGIDCTLRLWDVDGNLIGDSFNGHSSWVYSVAFNPVEDRVVSGSFDNTLRLWNLDGVPPIGLPFIGHSDSVYAVTFNSKGDLIISGSEDGTLRMWDLDGNAVGDPFCGHEGLVYSVATTLCGDYIVSGSADNTLRLWRGGGWEDWLRHCCTQLMHHTALAFPQTETAQRACEVCEQVWTRQQSAEFLVAQGNALARRGEVDQSARKYTRAKDLDPDLTLDPTARAQQLADWSQSPTAKPKT